MNMKPSAGAHPMWDRVFAVIFILVAALLLYGSRDILGASPFDYAGATRSWLSALALVVASAVAWRGTLQRAWSILLIGVALAFAYDAGQGWESDDSLDHFYALADVILFAAGLILWIRQWAAAFAVVLVGIAIQFLVDGARLIALGGSYYYVLAGLALVVCGVLLWRGSKWAARTYGLLLVATLLWGFAEVGIDMWALVPRVAALAILGVAFLTPWIRSHVYSTPAPLVRSRSIQAVSGVVVVLVVTIVAVSMHVPVVSMSARNVASNPNASAPTDWRYYGNTAGGTRYARLDEITPQNASKLKEIWHYRTHRGGVLKVTPLQIGALLYLCTAGNVVIALDADSGEKRWEFDPQVKVPGNSTFANTCRAVSYHKAAEDYIGECRERIITASTDARMFAVDALTGERCANFGAHEGKHGEISLLPGMGEVKRGFYFVTSPPTVARNVAVVGGWVTDNAEVGEPSGVVRAFDVFTGKFAWAWDMGRPGVHSEPASGEQYTRGTPNVWSIGSYDDKLGLLFLPTGNATPDYFGAHRSQYSEKYASSVVALDVATGEPKWSYQTVHHDIWDYDVPSQPALIDLPQADGSVIPALVQGTKRGELFMLDRRDGKPIAEVQEKAVPQGAVPEDWTSKTQPFSVGMPNFREPDWTEAAMWGLTPIDQLWCRAEFRRLRYEGHFTPPSTQGTLQFPGNAGGFNWGSLAIDEDRQLLVAEPLIMGNLLRLYPRNSLPKGVRSNQIGTPYAMTTRPFMSPLSVPCQQPPFGRLAVIDLQTRQVLWSKPLGTANESGPWGTRLHLGLPMGVPVTAGAMVTKGGVIFVGGTMDRYFRALDLLTGNELWRDYLPGTAQATPMSYLGPKSKRQIVVLTVPNATRRFGVQQAGDDERDKLDPDGGHVIAYAVGE
jgi:quinate dehydrogenase (quinone)